MLLVLVTTLLDLASLSSPKGHLCFDLTRLTAYVFILSLCIQASSVLFLRIKGHILFIEC